MSFDAIVIGTGFGGAVTTLRLTQAGLRVAVLERGRRYPRNAFPRNWHDPTDGWLWSHGQGLFDVRSMPGMQAVQAAGYGGGSLIYANVHLRPPADVFDRGWPEGYSREALDPYYDLVSHMLELRRIDQAAEPASIPTKTFRMRQVARDLGRADQFMYPPIAVNLEPPRQETTNRFGVSQTGCRGCGECDIGCNYHAKNTLDLNYLALAERQADGRPGAVVRTQCEAMLVEPAPGGGYRVHVRDHTTGDDERLEADRVFLCAGALNSTELLMRSRPRLPRLSEALGHRYSGNGDFLAFAFDIREPWGPSSGPTITTGLVHDRGRADLRTWFILEDGGFPMQVANLVGLLEPELGWLRDELILSRDALESRVRAAARQRGAAARGDEHVAVFLAMGRDRAEGVLRLAPITNDLCVEWKQLPNLPLYDAEEQLVRDVARALGGQAALNPFWRKLRVPITVHNLGGCTMADHPSDGVTDARGQVHYYPGLYVLDGAILPSATGVNPSHTIAAVTERNIEAIIRDWKRDPTWRAPERREAARFEDPIDRIRIPVGGTPLPRTPTTGLQFTETMRGHFAFGHAPETDYEGAEKQGRGNGSRMAFTLTIATNNLHAFLNDKQHGANASGTLHIDGLTEPGGATVTDGVFNLFVEVEGDRSQRRMLYDLPFLGRDGQGYRLTGFKRVQGAWWDVWPATTTLYTQIHRSHAADGPVIATGILHIQVLDFLRQLTTFEVTGTDAPDRKAEAFARFGALFAGTLAKVFRPRFITGPADVEAVAPATEAAWRQAPARAPLPHEANDGQAVPRHEATAARKKSRVSSTLRNLTRSRP